MKKAFALSLIISLITITTFSQTQPATFGIHFIYDDFQSAASIRTTSLSTTLRDKKFGRINNMSPGLALNYIHGLSPKFDFPTLLAGSFLDYPFQDSILSGEKACSSKLILPLRGKMFDNSHYISFYQGNTEQRLINAFLHY